MKVLINNNWIELSVFTGIMFGIAEASGEVLIMVGPFAVVIKTRMFKKRNRKSGPQKF
jgi:hypothetical protein